MDDLLFTSNDSTAISKIVQQLGHRFSLKDLGPLNYFLCVEVISIKHGLFLSQQKYIRDLLTCTKMDGAKAIMSPLATKDLLQLHDGSSPADLIKYLRVIGAL
ncbi:hypothetical protein F2P56_001680 [Juglans regia]|uniref:Reverse transcriptase Ty1/copia-type domain-containing protein n=1 Tax=Juglans regia TaxID=51240 RepID=A0A833YE49_JUGRE|nr:hypothetical protein F2P56_001680 [Juglans regia]